MWFIGLQNPSWLHGLFQQTSSFIIKYIDILNIFAKACDSWLKVIQLYSIYHKKVTFVDNEMKIYWVVCSSKQKLLGFLSNNILSDFIKVLPNTTAKEDLKMTHTKSDGILILILMWYN